MGIRIHAGRSNEGYAPPPQYFFNMEPTTTPTQPPLKGITKPNTAMFILPVFKQTFGYPSLIQRVHRCLVKGCCSTSIHIIPLPSSKLLAISLDTKPNVGHSFFEKLFSLWRVDSDIVLCHMLMLVGLHNILPLNFLVFGFCHHISIEIHSAKSKAKQCHRVFLYRLCVFVSVFFHNRGGGKWKM